MTVARLAPCPGREEGWKRFVLEAPLDVLLLDIEERVVAASPTYLRDIGLSLEDLRGKTLLEFAPGAKEPFETIRDTLAAGHEKCTLLRYYTPERTGSEPVSSHWYSSETSYWHDDQGAVCGYFLVTRDVTAEQEAELRRRKAEMLLQAVVDNIPATVTLRDFETSEYLFVNKGVTAAAGMTPEEIIGGRATELFPEWAASSAKSFEAAPTENGIAVVESDYEDKSGSIRALRLKQVTFEDAAGRKCVLGIGEDVTALRQATRDLELAVAEAKAANAAKSEFLANMSHEIRTPMNGILGMTNLLLATDLGSEQRSFAEVVAESGEALLTIVNDILDISKLEAGKLEVEAVDFDLVATVESAAQLLVPKAREKKIDLSMFIEPAARGAYQGDPTRLRQILLNLLSNAIKFTEQGGVSVQVSVTLGDTPVGDDHMVPLRFEVADTGIGMAESAQQRLFQKFSQADSSMTRRFGGTGLGLAICKQLVELMHGTIGVKSRLGEGSTFWCEIPFTRATGHVIDRETLPEHFKALRVLIVDDIRINLSIMERQLGALGIAATSACDGFDALAELERAWHRGHPYDLVFLDQMMPGMSGETLARKIRASAHIAETKLVSVSSAGRGSVSNDSELRWEAILEKPVRHQELLDTLINIYRTRADIREPAPPRVASATPDQDTLRPRPLRVLLAEDNRVNQTFATVLLGKAGHIVVVAANGHFAVDAVRSGEFDVILMDVQMPELDGIQATRQIRALPKPRCDIPIIAMTANAMTGAREEYLAAGMNDYVSKPIQPGQLFAKLNAIAGTLLGDTNSGSDDRTGGSIEFDAGDEPVLDLDKLAQLEVVLPLEQVSGLVSLYLTDVTHHLTCIQNATVAGDLAEAARHAHPIVSSAGCLGATQASAIARRFEESCRRGESDSMRAVATELAKACLASSHELKAWLNSRTATSPSASTSKYRRIG